MAMKRNTKANDKAFEREKEWLNSEEEPIEINPTEFDTRLQDLIGKFCGLPKEELIGSLRFWMNAIENDEEKQNGQEEPQVYMTKDNEVITYSENDGYKVVEPKFKADDWAVSNLDGKTRQISEVHFDEYNCYYVVEGKSVNLEEYDRLHHLWTIADIKDGDILTSEDGYPFIYAGHHIYTKYLTAYGGITNDGKFKISDKTELWTNDNVEPATKEECELLFRKMKEAGYEWDDKMKELTLGEEGYKRMFKNCTSSQYMSYKEKMSGTDIKESKSFWNEEDEMKFADILALLRGGENCHYNTPDLFAWFKSIKDRVYLKLKREWGEEDEKMIWAIPLIIKNYPNQEMFYGYSKEKLISWIKSLKERYAWKPNDKQIEALEHFVRSIGESGFTSPYDSNTKLIYSLLSELKKL